MTDVLKARLTALAIGWTCGVLVLGGCNDSSAPAQPQTLEDATRRFDAAIEALGWAQVDLWALGGRDIVVSVQLDSSLAPHYFRLPRQGAR